MFTGLVECAAPIRELREEPPGRRLTIHAPALAADCQIWASICVSGCCLTVVELRDGGLVFEAGPETLQRTHLGKLRVGDLVNLERSLKVGDLLGGHYVTGHVDALGTLDERRDEGGWSTLWFRAPLALLRQMTSKGSVAIDGVSLTLVEVTNERFSVALIPHTLAVTTLGRLQLGAEVNLETDILAKYVERQLSFLHSTNNG